jgi:tetratricopeptide (TPR) repeat protein
VARSALALAARLGRRSIQLYNNATLGGIRVGEWDWLETLLEAGLAEVVDPSFRTELLNDLGWLKGLRGEEIADLLVELDALVAGQTERQFGTASMWVRMFAVFAAGDLDEARTVNRRLAELFPEAAAFSLPFGARCALWAGDAPAARADLAALDATGARGPAIEADRTTIRAGIAALEGRPSDALPAYREALRAWRDLGLRWDEAQCAIDMATLLDPADPDVRAAAEAAREILVRLKAAPFIARLDAAMARTEARAESRATR